MTEADSPANDELERLRARLDRERRARRQAELIAERGMRELWENNRDLQERVERRTADLRHLADALELAAIVRSNQIAQAADELIDGFDAEGCVSPQVRVPVDAIRALAETHERSSPASTVDDPTVVADHIMERWQRRAARSGQLLAAEVSDLGWLRVSWGHLVAIGEVLLGAMVAHGGPGSVVLGFDRVDDELEFRLSGSVFDEQPATDVVSGVTMLDWAAFGPMAAELGVAGHLAVAGGGTLFAQLGANRSITVSARLPIG